jgi:hypothetical protein
MDPRIRLFGFDRGRVKIDYESEKLWGAGTERDE